MNCRTLSCSLYNFMAYASVLSCVLASSRQYSVQSLQGLGVDGYSWLTQRIGMGELTTRGLCSCDRHGWTITMESASA